MNYDQELHESIQYLNSSKARKALEADAHVRSPGQMTTALIDLPQVREFWGKYISSLPESDRRIQFALDAAFAGNESTTDELIQLYLDGKKFAGSSLIRDFEASGDPLPQVGNYWIALDGKRNPRCILKTTRIAINKFGNIPSEIAHAEGEGDLSVDYWKRVHRELYLPFLEKWGIADLDNADVITEYFDLVYPKKNENYELGGREF